MKTPRFAVALLAAVASGLLVAGTAAGQVMYTVPVSNPVALVGTYSAIPVGPTNVPTFPPSVNYPAFYNPMYQSPVRTFPPSVNYPAFANTMPNFAATVPTVPVAAMNYTNLAAVPGVNLANAAANALAAQNLANAEAANLASMYAAYPTANDLLDRILLAQAAGRSAANIAANQNANANGNPDQAGRTPAKNPGPTAFIDVQLPPEAELWFEGVKTKQTGPERHFRSPRLSDGREYAYTLRARWKEGGKTVEQRHELHVKAGDWYRVSMSRNSSEIVAVGQMTASR